MTPAARVQAAIDILAGLEQTQQPADRYLKDFFRARRYAGSKDRRAISERVFDILRHHARFAHRMGDADPRALAIASVLTEEGNVESLFTGGYGPAPLTEAEQKARYNRRLERERPEALDRLRAKARLRAAKNSGRLVRRDPLVAALFGSASA